MVCLSFCFGAATRHIDIYKLHGFIRQTVGLTKTVRVAWLVEQTGRPSTTDYHAKLKAMQEASEQRAAAASAGDGTVDGSVSSGPAGGAGPRLKQRRSSLTDMLETLSAAQALHLGEPEPAPSSEEGVPPT